MKPPYYAVVFTSKQTESIQGYSEMANLMETLAANQEGFLGIESARSHLGITVSYWKDLNSIKKWKQHTDHLIAQQKGRQAWYTWYKVRVCLVEHEYHFEK